MVDSQRRPGREDKQLIAGHFPKDVAKKLRMAAMDRETTVQALLGEAIDDLFVKLKIANKSAELNWRDDQPASPVKTSRKKAPA